MLALTRAGHTPRQIAKQLDISTQAVYQHLRRLRESGELTEGGR